MTVTPQSILSSALVGESPYNQAERVLEKLDAAGWEIVRKPRIPEPGLWGVVEAGWDSKGPAGLPRAEWMHTKGNEWRSCISNVAVRWADLIDPVLVRDGIEESS